MKCSRTKEKIYFKKLFYSRPAPSTSSVPKPRPDDLSSATDRSMRSSSEDIRSFCGSLTDVFSRSLSSYFSPNPPSTSRMPVQQDTANVANTSNPHGYGRSFFEAAAKVQTFPKSRVVFEPNNEVQELFTMGNVPSFDKQSQRGTTNPWRKYGALRKLHEIGGIAPPGNTKGDRKNKDGFVTIKKGSRPPPPPRCAEVTLNKDKRNPGLVGRIHLPRNVPAEQLSQAIAWEIKAMVEANACDLEQVQSANTGFLENADLRERGWQNINDRRRVER
ncbi:hypothetical protein Y032_0123g1139 [Ancylostoma ceylanicum]|uniref:Uncharacterized protein n=1 Tax=Ancylostoma ceylanicum TaxID=53326 RepID=A0A016T9E8_9BILA|nr:hypothetical protein Y032_0123g1139 [Ancylostoma ceylanicum]